MREDVLAKPPSKFRNIALPAQHGSWGFLVEPILLGLLIAPSGAGLLLSAATVSAFLVQRPLVIVIKDLRRQRYFERTRSALRFAIFFSGISLLLFALAVIAIGPGFASPLLVALPLALTQLGYEVRNQGRQLVPEVAGALALGATASMIALGANASSATAYTLWLLIGLRAVPSILYVRVRLQMKHGYKTGRVVPTAIHGVAFVSGLALCLVGTVSGLYLAAVGILFIRAIAGLRNSAQAVSARTIGFQEVGFGLLYVVIAAVALSG